MASRALWARATCGVVRIPYRDILNKSITQDQDKRITEVNTELMDAYSDRLMIDDRAQTTQDLWRKVANIKPDVIVVDHIRLFADRNDKEVKRLGEITWNLKKIAKEFDICVLALAQLNRQLEQRQDRHPTMADLRDSGEIEENADVILGLHRDKIYLEQPKEKTPADLVVMKFRDGPANQLIKLTFDGLGQWFDNRE
jgi:replicative DNA helicase